jgi:hypothetical protein
MKYKYKQITKICIKILLIGEDIRFISESIPVKKIDSNIILN